MILTVKSAVDPMYQIMRRLYPRGMGDTGIAVDTAGAMLGPDCVLVHRTAQGCRCIGRDEAAVLQHFLYADAVEPDWLFEECRRIAKALDNGEIALAQIYGLRIPIDGLDSGSLARLGAAAPLIKANFNPDEPRVPAGQPGGGEWTTDGGAEASATAPPNAGHDGFGGDGTEHSVTPAQITIPWDLPGEIPWEIPGAPSEITPLPFDFPGAERKRPPLPTDPFPRDPECAEEWAPRTDTATRWNRKESFGRVTPGRGKDYRSCLLGQVSERCGGNPTA